MQHFIYLFQCDIGLPKCMYFINADHQRSVCQEDGRGATVSGGDTTKPSWGWSV